MNQIPLNYGDYLEQQQRNNPAKRKGKRTQHRLELAAIRVLETSGFHDMRVSDICDAADVSTATFYLYFDNKREITISVLKNLLDYFALVRSDDEGASSAFAAIYKSNLAWLRLVRANAGLSRCLLQMGDHEDDFALYFQRISYRWYRYVVNRISRYIPASGEDNSVLMLIIYGMGAMIDDVARSMVVYPNPFFRTVLDEVVPTDEELAEFLSVLWYRGIFGEDPAPEELHAESSIKLLELKSGYSQAGPS
jgi:AcrR family transcriptional regulator